MEKHNYKPPKYKIGDILIVKDYKKVYEFYSQLKITQARYIVDESFSTWEYLESNGIEKSKWFPEDSIIELICPTN